MSDLPAAHSMDTAWFALDADGHVARFGTGEDGALPVGAAHRGGPTDPNFDIATLVAALSELAGTEPPEEGAYAERLPGVFDFTRDHGDDPGRYQRARAPERPVRLSELPPSAREAIGRICLPVRFSEAEVVHLADHLEDSEAVSWHDWPLRWPAGGAAAFFEEEEAVRRAAFREMRREEIRRAAILLLVLALIAALVWWFV